MRSVGRRTEGSASVGRRLSGVGGVRCEGSGDQRPCSLRTGPYARLTERARLAQLIGTACQLAPPSVLMSSWLA